MKSQVCFNNERTNSERDSIKDHVTPCGVVNSQTPYRDSLHRQLEAKQGSTVYVLDDV